MSTSKLSINAVHNTACDFRVTGAQVREPMLADFGRFATLVVMTGACGVQTYLTPEECEELSSMLLKAAQEVRESMRVAEAA